MVGISERCLFDGVALVSLSVSSDSDNFLLDDPVETPSEPPRSRQGLWGARWAALERRKVAAGQDEMANLREKLPMMTGRRNKASMNNSNAGAQSKF